VLTCGTAEVCPGANVYQIKHLWKQYDIHLPGFLKNARLLVHLSNMPVVVMQL